MDPLVDQVLLLKELVDLSGGLRALQLLPVEHLSLQLNNTLDTGTVLMLFTYIKQTDVICIHQSRLTLDVTTKASATLRLRPP